MKGNLRLQPFIRMAISHLSSAIRNPLLVKQRRVLLTVEERFDEAAVGTGEGVAGQVGHGDPSQREALVRLRRAGADPTAEGVEGDLEVRVGV